MEGIQMSAKSLGLIGLRTYISSLALEAHRGSVSVLGDGCLEDLHDRDGGRGSHARGSDAGLQVGVRVADPVLDAHGWQIADFPKRNQQK